MDNHDPVRLETLNLWAFTLMFKLGVLQGSIVGLQLFKDSVVEVLKWVTSTLDYIDNHDPACLDFLAQDSARFNC